MHSNIKFFLGANSNMDFVSYFEQLQGHSVPLQLLILKGGPGSGKSTLMKRVLAHAQKMRHDVEIIACASDPDSLDAVIDSSIGFAIMDGTAPHTLDPALPGARQHILYMGDLWNEEKLKEKAGEIEFLTMRIGDYHKAAGAYIKSAGALLSENENYSKRYVDKTFCSAFVAKALEEVSSAPRGTEKTRLLSAVSVGQIKSFPDTVSSLCDKIYVIDDKWGGGADYILKALLFHARIFGIRVVHCPCSVSPQKTDHILFPDIKTAFCTSFPGISFEKGEGITHEQLYLSLPDESLLQKRLEDSSLLLAKASALVKEAKLLHDDLESFYAKAMDFGKTEGLFENILKRFYK